MTKINSLCLLGSWDLEDPGKNNSLQNEYERNRHAELFDVKDFLSKVSALGAGTAKDACGWSESRQLSSLNIVESVVKNSVYEASTPTGTCNLFKTLYTNACESDCAYCINSVRNKKIFSYTPHEVASIFYRLSKKKMAQGFFLSSAMGKDPETTMAAMIQSVEILRTKYAFRGYVHLKILPGASRYQVKRAVQLADRVSLNVEQSSASRLRDVCSIKDYEIDILRRQAWIRDLESDLPSGQVTQFVVGASDETDREILSRVFYLYQKMRMRRIYYSAFKPVLGTRFQSRNATSSWRERRLYQVDWLCRVYHFPLKEIQDVLVDDFLPNADPKITLARLYINKPVEINEASEKELLRIPGIGPLSTKRILKLRQRGTRIRSRRQLIELGVILGRAQSFLKIDGNYQCTLRN